MTGRIQESFAELQKHAERHDTVLVSYSGGKDSLVVLDMCSRAFKRVVCFFKFMVPGLEVNEHWMRYATNRYGVEILRYPSATMLEALANGVHCNAMRSLANIPLPNLRDTIDIVIADTGIKLVATGCKKSASMARRRFFTNTANWEDVIHPIMDWSKFDVLAYMKAQGVPQPDSSGGHTTGVGLVSRSLFWLADKHSEDFEKLKQWFPYVQAVIKRRELFGE